MFVINGIAKYVPKSRWKKEIRDIKKEQGVVHAI
jgi:hypothetical protein